MKREKKTWLIAAGIAGAVILAAVILLGKGGGAKGPDRAARCTIAIRCDTVLDNLSHLDPAKEGLVPADGVLLPETAVSFTPGESAFELLKKVCQDKDIHFDFATTPGYGSAYIKGIGNLYELDCGERSGWLYHINGQSPDRGCSEYTLSEGDRVEFLYSCDWGEDLP